MPTKTMKPLQIVEVFERALRPLTEDEGETLKRQIVADGGVRDPLVEWDGKLIDGHHRLKIWESLQGTPEEVPPPKVIQMKFKSDDDAVAWIKHNQRARRNLTASEISELRGKRYNKAKGIRGGDRTSKGSDPTFANAAETIAKEDDVSTFTVKNDGAYEGNLWAIGNMAGFPTKKALVDAEVPKSVVAHIAKSYPTRLAMCDAIAVAVGKGKKATVPSTDEMKAAARERKELARAEREKEAARKAKRAEQAAEDAKRQRKVIEKSRKSRATKAMNRVKKTGTDEQVEKLEEYSELRTSLQIDGVLPDEDVDSIRHILSQDRAVVFEQLTDDEFDLLNDMVYAESCRRNEQ